MARDNENKQQESELPIAEEAKEAEENEGVEQKNAALQEENAALKDALVRAIAETDNLRKRFEKQMEEANKYALSSFIKDGLLEVLENLYRATDSIKKEELQDDGIMKNIYEGVEMTKNMLMDTFTKNGVRRIYPQDEEFDHNFHQSISHASIPGLKPGTVVQVIQAGYALNDRLLRPALVVVAKADE